MAIMITETPYNGGTLVTPRIAPSYQPDAGKVKSVPGGGQPFQNWEQIFGQVSSFLQETLHDSFANTTPTVSAPPLPAPPPGQIQPPEPTPCPITGQGRGLMPILAGVLLLILLFKE
jgi:hypothetical protein